MSIAWRIRSSFIMVARELIHAFLSSFTHSAEPRRRSLKESQRDASVLRANAAVRLRPTAVVSTKFCQEERVARMSDGTRYQ